MQNVSSAFVGLLRFLRYEVIVSNLGYFNEKSTVSRFCAQCVGEWNCIELY